MRLSIEQAKKYLQGMQRLWLCDEWGQPYDSERCRGCDSHDNCLDIVLASESMSDIAQDLYDTIEALQQENEQLRAQLDDWKYEVQCHMDEVIAREKQIEQLRVRVARMRELLTKAYDEIEKYKCLWKGSKPSGCDCPKPTALQDEIEQTLAEIDKAIGGKEDVTSMGD